MVSRNTTVCNRLGLHARAASKLVQVAQGFSSEISVLFGDKRGNAKSIMSVLVLGAPMGSELEISASGDDEDEALQAIIDLIEDRFGEGE